MPNSLADPEVRPKPERVGQTLSRRGLLGTAALGALVTAGTGFTMGAAKAGQPKRKSPTDRVAPRTENYTMGVAAQVFWRCDPVGKRIALTFDDGPDPRWTPMAFQALEEVGATATFFQLGNSVRKHPELTQELFSAGHEIASHGTKHQDLTDLSIGKIRDNLQFAHDAIGETIGVAPQFLRPPYGRIDSVGLFAAAEFNYRVALWSHHFPTDEAQEKADLNIATAAPGMIILCHDGRGTPADSLFVQVRRLLAELTNAGYEFTTVADLAQSQN